VAGILLVTHNGLGDSLIDCVAHVLGKAPHDLMVLSVKAKDDVQRKEEEGRAVIAHLDQGGGVLILADMFGATPSNIAMRLCELPNVAGVAGLNLPMLLRVITNADKPLAELAAIALEGGRDCIVPINTATLDNCNAAN
jgi:PTS system ascorbate-specific IIA component